MTKETTKKQKKYIEILHDKVYETKKLFYAFPLSQEDNIKDAIGHTSIVKSNHSVLILDQGIVALWKCQSDLYDIDSAVKFFQKEYQKWYADENTQEPFRPKEILEKWRKLAKKAIENCF